jgi:hypothetical protein
MTQDFRPSQVQLDYLNVDMIPHLEKLGIDVENYEYDIQTIDWYNWDNKPRWFVHISKYSALGKKVGYVEVDIYCNGYNGEDYPLGDISIELADHGFPCIATTVVQFEDGEYIIAEVE